MPGSEVELYACRTDVDITLGIVLKLFRTKEIGSVIHIGNGNVGTNALVFDGNQVLFGAILLVSCDMSRLQFPTKASVPE
jgi:hypothetical protein